MKINERTLVQVVHSSHTPIDRCGWLYKRGEVNKAFQKRWCVLKGNLFYYFDKKTDREPLGVIILEGCQLEMADNETELFAFKIDFGCDHNSASAANQSSGQQMRTYVLGTDSQQDMEGWLKALSCASYDYLKMIVSELQTKLDDINQIQDKRKQRSSSTASHQTVRHNPFDTDTNDSVDAKASQSPLSECGVVFTRRAFAEIHEFYGLKFREYIQQNRDKHKN